MDASGGITSAIQGNQALNTSTQYGAAVQAKALDEMKSEGQQMVKLIDSSVGQNVDVKA